MFGCAVHCPKPFVIPNIGSFSFMIKFIHIRRGIGAGLQEKGGITVAYDFDPGTRVATFAVAKCSLKDNYCKAIGRAVSTGRLLHRAGNSVRVPEGHSIARTVVASLPL